MLFQHRKKRLMNAKLGYHLDIAKLGCRLNIPKQDYCLNIVKQSCCLDIAKQVLDAKKCQTESQSMPSWKKKREIREEEKKDISKVGDIYKKTLYLHLYLDLQLLSHFTFCISYFVLCTLYFAICFLYFAFYISSYNHVHCASCI